MVVHSRNFAENITMAGKPGENPDVLTKLTKGERFLGRALGGYGVCFGRLSRTAVNILQTNTSIILQL